MIEHAIPLQMDLFTGELIDARTSTQKRIEEERQQPQQIEMFSQRDTAQFGVNARPVMPLSPGKLVLLAQDLRTEDEIERDLLRQAQANTPDLFAIPSAVLSLDNMSAQSSQSQGLVEILGEAGIETSNPNNEVDTEPTGASPDSPVSKYAAYLALVNASEERAATLYNTPVSALSESIAMNLAKLDAQSVGLTPAEMDAALKIGAYRGRTTSPVSQPDIQERKDIEPHKAIPILWTSRADMLKRRPDLTPQLAKLQEHEIKALASLVGEALQEFYWIQLNVVLSLFLDHDLRLTRNP